MGLVRGDSGPGKGIVNVGSITLCVINVLGFIWLIMEGGLREIR
jgi:hypothetical protein